MNCCTYSIKPALVSPKYRICRQAARVVSSFRQLPAEGDWEAECSHCIDNLLCYICLHAFAAVYAYSVIRWLYPWPTTLS